MLNGGGSRTYARYNDDLETPINDIAMGSAFLFPGNFANIEGPELARASFLASPVLKRVDPAEVPFAPGLLPALALGNPSLETAYYLTGGGFPGAKVFPAELIENPLIPGQDGVNNLLPNQSQFLGPRGLPLDVNDFVFYHPQEGDGIRWINQLEIFRSGQRVAQWENFQPGTPGPV